MKPNAHFTDPSPFESGIWGTADQPCPSERTLAAHVDGQLEASRAEAVEAHLDRCSTCAGAARRVEGLSDLLRTWESGRRAESPARLRAAVLRTVAPEAAALRRESMRASKRSLAFAAGVLVALGAGVLLARSGSNSTRASASTRVTSDVVASSPVEPLAFAPLSIAPWIAPTEPFEPRARDGVGRGASVRGPVSDAPFADDEATRAFARYAAFRETEERVGELVYVVDDRALPACAAGPYARVRRLEAWWGDRARKSAELVTLDPSAAGFSVLDVLPLPRAAEMAAFVAKLRTLVCAASRRSGGLLIRPLPGRVLTPTEADAATGAGLASGNASSAGVASSGEAEDLETAVAARRVVLRPDVRSDRTSVTLDVAPTTTPILIPAGELLAGGAGDRVVVEGLWLPPYASSRTVVLACLPVSRDEGGLGAPTPTGLVAGPELRGLVAYRADRDAVFALVDSQVTDAAVDRGVGGRTSLLALYDRESSDVAVARALAKDYASRFGDDTAGFVVSDLNDRFQGLEHTAFHGAARRALLERLLVGYLIEAHTRTSIDAPRSGAAVDVALSRLVEGAARLSPAPSAIELRGGVQPVRVAPGAGAPAPTPTPAPTPPAPPRRLSGEEPRSGVRLEGVPGETPRPPLVSGLVPGIR